MSAVELWTGRDMLTGRPLQFSQEDIIERQHKRRVATHNKSDIPLPVFALGDIVFSNSDRSKLKARDKLIVREDLGDGQYRLDRICSKSGFTTSTIKPAYDLYGIAKDEVEAQPRGKSVTWSDDIQTSEDKEEPSPAPRPNNPANDPGKTRAEPQRGRAQPLQWRSRHTPPPKRPLPPAPGRAASYCPQTEHGFMIITSYGPDDETLCGIIDPTQDNQEEDNDTPSTQGDSTPHSDADPDTTENTTTETDSEEDFHSPEASSRAQTSPDDSPEQDPENDEQDLNNESPSEPSPLAQAGPSNRQDQNPSAGTADPNDGNLLSRGDRGRAPVKRMRSLSHPPTQKPPKAARHYHAPGSLCAPCQQKEKAIQQDERAIQLQREQDPVPVPVQNPQEEAPPAENQRAQLQTTTRSGRTSTRPSHLAYQSNFEQHETREATPQFRLPRPMPPKPTAL